MASTVQLIIVIAKLISITVFDQKYEKNTETK